MESNDSKNWFARVHHLHYVYIIIILLVVLIGYLAYCHCAGNEGDKQLLTFLSFAATISSIILSVLAIIITVLSSGSTDRLRDSVMQMSLLPKEIADRFDKSSAELNNASSRIERSTQDNKEVSEKSIAAIQEKINQLSGEIDERYKGHDKKIEQVSKQVEEVLKQSGGGLGADVKVIDGITEEQISFFLERTSKATIGLLYFIQQYLYRHITKPVSLTAFAIKLGYTGENTWMGKYFFASIVQMNSFKLVEYSNDTSDLDTMRFSSLNSILSKEIDKHFLSIESVRGVIDEFVESLVDKHLGEEK